MSIEREADSFAGVNYLDRNGEAFAAGRYVQDSYFLINFAVGIGKDDWNVELYIDNLADENAILNIDTQQFTPKVVTNRPRTIGLRFSYDFF